MSRSAKTSWIEIPSTVMMLYRKKSRSAKTSWIEILADEVDYWNAVRRGLRRPRGLKYLCDLIKKVKLTGRGLRRPRGLKLNWLSLWLKEICRGLRRPRGLKCNNVMEE